ncbi:MAG: hypothetical protein C0412_15280 [Flavobacterium sp.]|nr:hypothetical protein [Flavobacterium sp.]
MDVKRIKLNEDFEKAKLELKQMGTIITKIIEVPDSTFTRVSIIINGEIYRSEHKDPMIATIQLRNQI